MQQVFPCNIVYPHGWLLGELVANNMHHTRIITHSSVTRKADLHLIHSSLPTCFVSADSTACRQCRSYEHSKTAKAWFYLLHNSLFPMSTISAKSKNGDWLHAWVSAWCAHHPEWCNYMLSKPLLMQRTPSQCSWQPAGIASHPLSMTSKQPSLQVERMVGHLTHTLCRNSTGLSAMPNLQKQRQLQQHSLMIAVSARFKSCCANVLVSVSFMIRMSW